MNGSSQKSLIVSLAMVAALITVEAQLQQLQQLTNFQGLQQQASSVMDRVKSMLQMDPLVEVGDSELGGRKVNVHVPGIYDLKLDSRGEHQGVRIKQSVMMGLVSIFIDRTRDSASGRNSGPISVRVGGLPMYQNSEARNLGTTIASA